MKAAATPPNVKRCAVGIKIVRGGLLTTVQDTGRAGYMKYGFSQCGAMDIRAMKTANILLSNDPFAAVLEMTLTGIAAVFTEDCAICISGGKIEAAINKKPIVTNKVYEISAGDVLICEKIKKGVRSYLAVSGGIDVPEFFSSRSTDLKAKAGGFCGRKLQTGDDIGILPHSKLSNIEKRQTDEFEFSNGIVLRAVPGPQDFMFTKEDLNTFFSEDYKVSAQADRMGIRLSGPVLKGEKGMDIISDGIAPGSVQVPESGQPIILAADRQTTGGYAKIATVISADMPMLAQALPGCFVKFRCVSVSEAEKAARAENEKLSALKNYIENL